MKENKLLHNIFSFCSRNFARIYAYTQLSRYAAQWVGTLDSEYCEQMRQLSERQASLGIVGAELSSPLEPLNTIVLFSVMVVREVSWGPLYSKDTFLFRTAIRVHLVISTVACRQWPHRVRCVHFIYYF